MSELHCSVLQVMCQVFVLEPLFIPHGILPVFLVENKDMTAYILRVSQERKLGISASSMHTRPPLFWI